MIVKQIKMIMHVLYCQVNFMGPSKVIVCNSYYLLLGIDRGCINITSSPENAELFVKPETMCMCNT
jgi:hypothetical protein